MPGSPRRRGSCTAPEAFLLCGRRVALAGAPPSGAELDWLARRRAGGDAPPDLVLTVEEGAPWKTPFRPPDGLPAEIVVEGDRVLVRGAAYRGEVRPGSGTARLVRVPGAAEPLHVLSKVALSCLLPLSGGLLLHAAGVAAPSGAVLFFGPSGAGKSTLAGLSPYPVLSDELVALLGPPPFRGLPTGFWGTLPETAGSARGGPVGALVELEKGPAFGLARLSPAGALRRLLGVALMPPVPSVWSAALGVLGSAVAELPVYRMAWSPEEPPWERLEQAGVVA